MFNLCKECDRLWRKYAVATAEHILSTDRLKKAIAALDAERIFELMQKVEAAEAVRRQARLAIQHHELSAHLVEGGGEAARAAGA